MTQPGHKSKGPAGPPQDVPRENPGTVFDQRGQTVGTQINVGGDLVVPRPTAATPPSSAGPPRAASSETAAREIIRAKRSVDFAIITIREDEFKAVLRHFPPTETVSGEREYNICYVPLPGSKPYTAAVVRCAEQGNGESQDAARDLIADLDPQWLLVVGIAGGVPDNEFTLGDVILSTKIYDLTVSAAKPDGARQYSMSGGRACKDVEAFVVNLPAKSSLARWNEPDFIGMSRPSLDPAKKIRGDKDLKKKVEASLRRHFRDTPRSYPIFKDGPIASSDTLVKDPDIIKSWQTIARHVLAVEMESGGVYRAARRRRRDYPMLAIRGISDIVGLERDPQWTAYACHTAAAFTRSFISLGLIPPSTEPRVANPLADSPGPSPLDESAVLTPYLRHVIEDNRSLKLQGIRSASDLVRIDLEQIYITLTATERRAVTDEAAWVGEMAQWAPGEAQRVARLEGRPREAVQAVKINIQEALAAHPRLVVLGDPGSGKTTLLRYLALTYARAWQGEPELVRNRLQLDEQRLPILLPLRDFARYLEKNHPDSSTDGPKQLLDYLHTYFTNQDMALPERFFADRLRRGACAVLLDGVDEVADLALRHRVARVLERLTRAYPDNRYVITSRLVGYVGSARLGEDYAVTTVRDFTESDIERFVGQWQQAVEVARAGCETSYALTEARRQAEALLGAIRKNERVRDLAVNPLLLTVIALVHRYRAQLPERRTELYEEAIEVLLGKWDEARGLQARAMIVGRPLDAGDRRALLEPVALWMMEKHLREIEAEELRQQLGRRFFELTGDRSQAGKAVEDFLRLINERSGLLSERGQGVYAFSHLTFQEHLAARAVSDRPDYLEYTLACLGDSWWREVILLEAGYLSMQGKRRPTALIGAIIDCPKEPEPYHNLVLAAECLRDVGPVRVEGDLWGEVQRRLRKEFEQPLRKPAGRSKSPIGDLVRRRAAAAEALARIESGGPVTQPAFWRLPYGEPVWVDVPAGEFWMGSEKGEPWEKPVQRVYLDRFQIARVPITHAQYRLFVEATGHKRPRNWDDGKPPRGQESHPVTRVSWYDAMAYCRWLSRVTGRRITLPSEAQWEKAARGDRDRREYPWGEEWDASMCNNSELELEGTTPVGIFPEGASPYGGLDMAGNVWEWTSTLWGEDWRTPKFGYPYDPSDGREDLEASASVIRVLRGGAFFYDRTGARCAFRDRHYPESGWDGRGFRVVVAPISGPLSSGTLDSGTQKD